MMDPKIIARMIFDDIKGRKGVGDELDCVDEDIQLEMIDEWAAIIARGCGLNTEGK